MVEPVVAVYFGVGVGLTQLLHTYYAHRSYHQKGVRLLEWIPGFSREDPAVPERIRPLWRPWDLPPEQMPYTPKKSRRRRAVELLGLQATNVVYCYVLSVVYAVLAVVVVSLAVPAEPGISTRSVLLVVSGFGGLVAFSFLAVGTSWAVVTLEGNLVLNTLLLSWAIPTFQFTTVVTVFAVAITITAAALGAWVSFQTSRGVVEYGNLVAPIVFAVGSFVYSEVAVILALYAAYA